jgi:hypothetical protein
MSNAGQVILGIVGAIVGYVASGFSPYGAAGEWLFAGTSDLTNGLSLLALLLAGYYGLRSIRERLPPR